MSLKKMCKAVSLRSVVCSLVLIGGTALVTTRVMSQEYGDKKGGDQGGMTEADMKKWMEMNQPGPFHQKLDVFAGTWNVKSKCWMDPSKPEEGSGKATFKWVLDRRYLTQDYEGTSAMGPFKGMGIFGYDNMKKKYWNVWMDSMGTAPMMSDGSSDSMGRTFTFMSEYDCPMTGKHMKSKQVMKVESPSKFIFEMYDIEGSSERKSMEITYTKA